MSAGLAVVHQRFFPKDLNASFVFDFVQPDRAKPALFSFEIWMSSLGRLGGFDSEVIMLKRVAIGLTTLFVATSPLYAQSGMPSPSSAASSAAAAADRLSSADWSTVADARIAMLKGALQLTADQEKNWPAVEQAIRNRIKNREERISETVGAAVADVAESGGIAQAVRNRDPAQIMHRRADALQQRANDLNKLAEAWGPLYQSLTPEQKRRLVVMRVVALHEMRNALENRRSQTTGSGSDDDDDDTY
jgi:hypothetical protein